MDGKQLSSGVPRLKLMIRCRDGDTRVRIFVGARQISAHQVELDAFRERMGHGGDVMSSLDRHLLWSHLSAELPLVLKLHRSGQCFAIVLATVRKWRGIPTGLVRVGNLAGQGGVVASPADGSVALEIAARTLLRIFLAHTVVASLLQSDAAALLNRPSPAGMKGYWRCREARIRLNLAGGVPALLDRLSYKMRRNLRYYRKRAEMDMGVKLVAEMSGAERNAAVVELHDSGPYPVDFARARSLDMALQTMPSHFAMGLQDAAGNWISYITGWRADDATYIDWQLNSDHHDAASICTVMRSFLLEHEAACGSKAIIFVGLTNPFWARACDLQICADLVMTRNGVLGAITRRVTLRLSPNGQVASLLTGSGRAMTESLTKTEPVVLAHKAHTELLKRSNTSR